MEETKHKLKEEIVKRNQIEVTLQETNQKLSEDRANSVRNFLIKNGIAGDRIIAKGYGDTQPIAENNTDAGKQKNRRTEVRTIKE